MEEKKISIHVDQISKVYKLYEKPSDRMKEALGLSKKKIHKENYALRNVDIKIYQGETVGIIGTNGSGKSTILKIITGVLNPTSGNLTVNGRISALLELGAGFNMEYTGIENIYLNGAVMGFDHKYMDAHFEEILEFSELRDFIDVPVKNYSSGMIARLGFSIATITKPDILIVDEVLAVGDENFQKKCINKIHSLLENNTTLLFVSHNSDTVQEICNRAIWLDGGKLMIDADSKTACDAYRGI